jgi:hypothetical protein
MKRVILIALAGLALAACAGAPAPSATPPLTSTVTAPPASATPLPLTALDFGMLPESLTGDGLPRLGFPNAPVSVSLYLSLDDPAAAQFLAQSMPTLISHAQGAEILLTTLPLPGDSGNTDALGAARAALCAADQERFHPYLASIMADLAAQGAAAAYAGDRLLAAADALRLDRSTWTACMASRRPDHALEEAARLFAALPYGGRTPLVLVDGAASLPDPDSLNFTIDRAVRTFSDQFDRALAENTPEVTPVVVPVDPLTGDTTPPPLTIALPEGWSSAYNGLMMQDIDAIRSVQFALYRGPVPGGDGTIVVLWAFPNVAAVTSTGAFTTDLWMDGLRLLRMAVIEPGCNIGTDLRRSYTVGEREAAGTQFSAVDCPETPDTRGWFAGLNEQGLNYVFYMYTDPIGAMDEAAPALQSILDSVRFDVLPTPQAAAEAAP